jgi:hypothetical protein
LKGWAISDIVHPDDLAGAIDANKRAFETGQPGETEARVRTNWSGGKTGDS